MKHTSFYLLALLLLGVSCAPQPKEVCPVYWKETSSNDLYIQKLELTDSATILHCDMSCSYREWKMNTGSHLEADGRRYAFLKGQLFVRPLEGDPREVPFALGVGNGTSKNPESGERGYRSDSLVLYFEPLPLRTASFDFIEGDTLVYGNWHLAGIHTDGKPFPLMLPQGKVLAKDGALPAPATTYGKAVVKGHIYGLEPRPNLGIGYHYRNPFTQAFDLKDKIDSTGDFRVETYLFQPTTIYIGLPGQSFNLLLAPNEELELDYDLNAVRNRDIQQHFHLATDEGAEKQNYCFGGTYGALNEIIRQGPAYYTLVIDLKRYLGMTFQAYAAEQWDSLQARKARFSDANTYEPLEREWLTLQAEAIYTGNMKDYLEKIGSGRYFSDLDKGKEAMEPYVRQYTPVDPHLPDLSFLKDSRSLYFLTNYNDYESYLPYMEANGLAGNEVYTWMKDYLKAREVATRLNLMKPLQEESELQDINPAFVPLLKEMNDTVFAQKKRLATNSSLKELPDVAPEKLLEAIVKLHPGKAVFFDCWATWCNPCRKGIADMEPLKKELAGENVVFIYLTNESSPSDTYLKMIQDIPGEHYRMSTAVWNKLEGVGDGIPFYLLYNKNGKKVFTLTGWSEELLPQFKEKILSAMGD